MNVRLTDGSTELDNLISSANQGDRVAQQKLDGLPTFSPLIKHIWDYWQELNIARRNYGWGVTPLTYSEIYAWTQLRRIQLDAWELDTLMSLDAVYMTVESQAAERRRQPNGNGS